LENKDYSVQVFQKVIDFMKKYGGLDYTYQSAARGISAAKDALSVFAASATRDTLLVIADYALIRKS
jgi:octaprenyl-diphosphate synthase